MSEALETVQIIKYRRGLCDFIICDTVSGTMKHNHMGYYQVMRNLKLSGYEIVMKRASDGKVRERLEKR